MNKSSGGRFFEDFAVGQEIVHATPRTVSEGDAALYIALTGSRFAIHCSDPFAQSLGLPRATVEDVLVFNMILGKTVPDISLNAVANLGYAGLRFGAPVYPGDTLLARSEVIGVKENSGGKTGLVYVHTTGTNQRDEMVIEFFRWVMMNKRDPKARAPEPLIPELPDDVKPEDLVVPDGLDLAGYDTAKAGSPHLWDDFEPGERIDHVDGMTVEEAEHMMATRLYQNTARVHFNEQSAKKSRFARRLIFGGHIISLARALSYNGLANAFRIAAINSGRHAGPTFAGDTLYAWSHVIGKAPLPGRDDIGALRLRLVCVKDQPCDHFPLMDKEGKYHPTIVLDLDYWVLMPRRA